MSAIEPGLLVAVWAVAVIRADRSPIVARIIHLAVRIHDSTVAIDDAAVPRPPDDRVGGHFLVLVVIVENDRRRGCNGAEDDVARARLAGGFRHRRADGRQRD